MPKIFVTDYFAFDEIWSGRKLSFTWNCLPKKLRPQPVYVVAYIVDKSGVQFELKKHELEAYELAIKKVRG